MSCPRSPQWCYICTSRRINSILISGFWSVINERFDPYAAKTVIARVTAAATFGGLLGGIAANTVAYGGRYRGDTAHAQRHALWFVP